MTRWRFAIGLCLAAVLWAGAALSQPAPQEFGPAVEDEPIAPIGEEEGAPAGEQDAAPEQGSALELLPAVQGIEAAIRDLIAQEDAAEREAERRRDEADLRAQQAMARWAFWATLAAGASVFLTAVGVLLIWQTLKATRLAAVYAGGAVEQSRLANKSTQAAVAVTRQMGEAQTRAYLQFEIATLTYVTARNGDGLKVTGKITNYGRSPALNMKVGGLVSGQKPDLHTEMDPRVVMTPTMSYMAASFDRSEVAVTIPFKDFIANDQEVEEIWCLVVVLSEDIFGSVQLAPFRGRLVDKAGRTIALKTLKEAMGTGEVGWAWE